MSACATIAAMLLLTDCRQDMQNQPMMLPLLHSSFFADGPSGRQPVSGTVDRSQSYSESYLLTGAINGSFGDALPFSATYRWAITACIRALQLSQHAPAAPSPLSKGVAASEPESNLKNLTARNVAPAQANSAEAETAEEGDPDRGKKVYTDNCSVCHQANRAGIPPVFPSLLGVIDRVGEKRVRSVARDGIPDATPPMPAHPNLTDADIDDLIAYLRSK